MKKYLIFVVGFILGIIGTSYAAYKLRASEVSFNKTNTGLDSDDVQGAIDELGANLSSGKQLLADAITNKGMSTSDTDSFETMANNINNIKSSELSIPLISISGWYLEDGKKNILDLEFDVSEYTNLSYNLVGTLQDGSATAAAFLLWGISSSGNTTVINDVSFWSAVNNNYNNIDISDYSKLHMQIATYYNTITVSDFICK